MRSREDYGKLLVKDGTDVWVLCPQCRMMRLIRLPPDGCVRGFPYCRRCKREQYLNIDLSLSRMFRRTRSVLVRALFVLPAEVIAHGQTATETVQGSRVPHPGPRGLLPGPPAKEN